MICWLFCVFLLKPRTFFWPLGPPVMKLPFKTNAVSKSHKKLYVFEKKKKTIVGREFNNRRSQLWCCKT